MGLILLIVCINVSNLLLSRAMSRSKEFALRTALGAGRGRLARQLLTESLRSGAGAALGLVFAWAFTFYLAHENQMALPLLSTVRVDGTALAWTVLIAISVGAVFGLAPAFRVSDGNLHQALKDGGSGMSQGRRHERLRATLVVSEVALACVLLIGAGLLLRSFLRLLDVDLGFAPDHVSAIKIDVEDGGNLARRGPVLEEILRRIRAIPGIEAAGMTDMLPLDRNRSWGLVAKENVNDRKPHGAFVYVVTPGYLETMGMRLLQGRDISWRDRSDTERAIIVNEAAARREWPGQDPVGRVVYGVGRGESRVVGVISDVRESSLEDQASAQVYIPMTQADPEGTELVVRTPAPGLHSRAGGDVDVAEPESGAAPDAVSRHSADRGSCGLAAALPGAAGQFVRGIRAGCSGRTGPQSLVSDPRGRRTVPRLAPEEHVNGKVQLRECGILRSRPQIGQRGPKLCRSFPGPTSQLFPHRLRHAAQHIPLFRAKIRTSRLADRVHQHLGGEFYFEQTRAPGLLLLDLTRQLQRGLIQPGAKCFDRQLKDALRVVADEPEAHGKGEGAGHHDGSNDPGNLRKFRPKEEREEVGHEPDHPQAHPARAEATDEDGSEDHREEQADVQPRR